MKVSAFPFLAIVIGIFLLQCSPARQTQKPMAMQVPDSVFLRQLLSSNPFMDSLLNNQERYRIQIIYTQIDRDQQGVPSFHQYYLNKDSSRYFYPASTVKLPVALLALQKIKELQVPGLTRHSTMITDSAAAGEKEIWNEPVAKDGRPTIDQYIRQILLVSDNEAFNRLYEFLGQEYINQTLHKMGYTDIQILHRLNISLTEQQNRTTNPVSFYDTAAQLLYTKPLQYSQLVYASRNDQMGKGYYSAGKLVQQPFDFSAKNRMALADLHQVVQSVFFPDAVPPQKRFDISADDRLFVQKYMGMVPRESDFPDYDSTYYDDYVKFLFYGSQQTKAEPGIRIFNKVGDAYGFLTDAAYIVDYKNKVEFLLSAVIHCNADGIYNDDQYEYNSIGYPFMKLLGRMIYDFELKRSRRYPPSLTEIQFNYSRQAND